MKGTFYIICCAILLGVECCTFPSILEGKLWEDSAKGKPVTFSGDTMTGWNVSIFNTVMSSWQCLFNQNDIIVSRSSYEQSIPLFSTTTYYVYACMWIVSIDAQTLIYYLLADEITDANTRIYKSTNDSLGACDVCKFSLTLNSADGKAMSTTDTFPSPDQPYSPVTCESVLQTTTKSSTTYSSAISTPVFPTVSLTSTGQTTHTVTQTATTEIESSSTSTVDTTTINTTPELTFLSTLLTSSTLIPKIGTSDSSSTSPQTNGIDTSQVSTMISTGNADTSHVASTDLSTTIVSETSSTANLKSHSSILPFMSDEAFIAMLTCVSFIILVLVIVTTIVVCVSVKSKRKHKARSIDKRVSPL
uniref:A-agglutinin anchorage subunit-like isoform X1 n=1 Tax=Crassostrea virginica TaxID=6565 RepID=A0A8B8DJG5_CRAVI|nr:A-agglutinin anchorage subunit-like isoform X1 [Crassostrea virginica]